MQKYETSEVIINGRKFRALVADTFVKKLIGLMFRKHLSKRECMLFIFPYEGFHGIWMHNMLFAIDVVWANGKKRVVDFAENLRPCSSKINCKTYYPGEKSKYVIELNCGVVKSCKIRRGSKVEIQFKP